MVLDSIQSYAGIRSVGRVKDANGHWRFTLNGEVVFHWGTARPRLVARWLTDSSVGRSHSIRYPVAEVSMLNKLRGQGIAAGVYTQTTDVEGEINGLMTYDRKVIKIPAKDLADLHRILFSAPNK